MTNKNTTVITTAAISLVAFSSLMSIRSSFKLRKLRKKFDKLDSDAKEIKRDLTNVNDEWSSTKGHVDSTLENIKGSAAKVTLLLNVLEEGKKLSQKKVEEPEIITDEVKDDVTEVK